MLHLMRQSISFETTARPVKPSDAGPGAPVTTVARIGDYANELGSFNRPRDTWFPASVVDTAVALLTGELETAEGVTFTADDSLCPSGARYIAAPVRDNAAGTWTGARATLHGFTRRQLKLISARVWGKPQHAGPVNVRVVGTATAVIVGPGFQGGVRRHPDKPRAFQVLAFGVTAAESEVIGTATTYAKAGALLASHNGQPDLPVIVERGASAERDTANAA